MVAMVAMVKEPAPSVRNKMVGLKSTTPTVRRTLSYAQSHLGARILTRLNDSFSKWIMSSLLWVAQNCGRPPDSP